MKEHYVKKSKTIVGVFKLQHMILTSKINLLVRKIDEVQFLLEKSYLEYFSILKEINELKSTFSILLEVKFYNGSFETLDKKYNEYLAHKRLIDELRKELKYEMSLLIVQKRKIDHFDECVKRNQRLISFSYLE